MTEHEYIVVSALQRLRVAVAILRDVPEVPAAAVSDARLRPSLLDLSSMIEGLEAEARRLTGTGADT